MATIFFNGKQIAGGGVSVVHMTEAQYLQNKTALDASDLLIEITDKDYPVEAGNIGFTPPTGMNATNVQDAIEEIGPRTLATVTADGVKTYSECLLQLKSAFLNLTAEERKRSAITVDSFVFTCTYITDNPSFGSVISDGGDLYVQSIKLLNATAQYRYATIGSSGNVVYYSADNLVPASGMEFSLILN